LSTGPARIRLRDVHASAALASSPAAFLERDRELALLGAALEAVAVASRGEILLVGGEAGVGKTTLLRGFKEQLADSTSVFWGACDPLFTPRPLGPLFEVADQAGDELRAVVTTGGRPHEVAHALSAELVRRPGSTGRPRSR
jgi:predicted ATPase